MKLKESSWKNLTGEYRITARIERIARGDTIFGGCSALMLAKRLNRMGGTDLRHVVSDVYAVSSGYPHTDFAAFECPECGNAHLGMDAALQCCAPCDE